MRTMSCQIENTNKKEIIKESQIEMKLQSTTDEIKYFLGEFHNRFEQQEQ